MAKRAKPRGRPPQGLGKKGEPARIRDYPRVLVTMRPATQARLKALAKHQDRAEWRIIDEALLLYFDEVSNSPARAGPEPRT
jgi:hypothetical protein